MNFEWDEHKNQTNIRKHGLSFADAWELFEAPMLIDLDDRIDYGEDRWIGIAVSNHELLWLFILNLMRPFASSHYGKR